MKVADCEQEGKSRYGQFSEGNNLSFALKKINSDGSLTVQEYNAQIEAVKGGGFFGQVLLFKDLPFILKTAIPDPWHDLWRRVNWGARDFPYQINEHDAQIGQLTTDLIHTAVDPLTKGKLYAPKSFGYALLPGTFAQAVERLYGRPPRYDNNHNEFSKFRQAQQAATDLYYKLGLEHVGQIHTDNPFAMANLWRNEVSDRWESFDTLPAIRHTGRVWPMLLPYKFHYLIRRAYYPDKESITFDRIHTDKYLNTVEKNRNDFSEETLIRIRGNVSLYEELMFQKTGRQENVRNYRALAYAGEQSAINFGQSILYKAKDTVLTPYRILMEPDYINKLVLGGVQKALDTNTISEDVYQEAVSLVQGISKKDKGRSRFLKTLKGGSLWSSLYAYYHISGSVLKVPEIAAYANFGLGDIIEKVSRLDFASLITPEGTVKLGIFLGIFSGARVAGGLNSYLATKSLARLSGRKLDTAARISAIPLIGIHMAIPAQFCVDLGSRSETIWHYTVRNAIAKISKINPAGGWGSQFEGVLWNKVGKRIEKWAK